MKNFARLLAKEIKEILRTYKLFVVPGLFLLFGLTSPILTKLLPELLGSMVGEIGISLPEMTWVDSYAQFFKNLGQLGLLALILTTMGTIAEERNRGVAQLVLTKPVPRWAYVLAKYAANLLLLSLSAALAFGAAWFYTDILFSDTIFLAGLQATAIFLLNTAVILAVIILASSLSKSTIAAGGLTVLGLILLKVLPFLSDFLGKYSPDALGGYLVRAYSGAPIDSALWGVAAFSLVTIVLLLGAAVWVFSGKEL